MSGKQIVRKTHDFDIDSDDSDGGLEDSEDCIRDVHIDEDLIEPDLRNLLQANKVSWQ